MTTDSPIPAALPVDEHWENVYASRSPNQVSWYQPAAERSRRLIQRFAPDRRSRIIDIGAGASPLARNLLDAGYEAVTVLDVSPTALATLRADLGDRRNRVSFVLADLRCAPRLQPVEVWHDRAVFHFLIDPADRERYVALALRTISAGGHLILATFAPDGPDSCSGLPVRRYDAESLAAAIGPRFTVVAAEHEEHLTPSGARQSFTYAVFQRA